MAAQFLDLLWPLFLLAGIERVRIAPGNTRFTPLDFYDYPISHSLATSVAWAAGFALIYRWLRRDGRGSLVLGLAVFSHWVLDFVAHRPDLPLAPGSSRYFGLGLWNSVAATLAVELLLFLIGLALYLSSTRARDLTGRLAFWSLIAVLVIIYFANVMGSPPPSVKALAWVGMGQWLFVAWGFWADRHRIASAGEK
ncbi:MAG TPA: hypothetical protein VK473_04945 [Terriglobales bacterium]|nr:hypothetical protein [Terriglobales bacterium]